MNKYNVFQRLPHKCELIVLINRIKKLNEHILKNKTQIIQYQLKDDLKKRIDKCEKKYPNNPCMLGIWRNFEWIEMVLRSITSNVSIEDLSFSMFNLKRPKIERKKRINVWKKRNGSTMDGKCMVCEENLSFEDMECGHIESFFNGGSNDITNLEPICKTCNRDMGILNLELYKKNLG
jgi:5-methylcytosine-specific restriction endonuclease McrA